MTLSAMPKSVSSLSKSILILSVSLAFAAFTPAAFAQRGGGGHGGGHIGGARGGSIAHASGATGAVRSSTGSAGRGASASGRSSSAGASASTSTRGYSRNTFVPESATRDGNYSAISQYISASSQSTVGTRAFAANNRYWEDPPQQGHPMTAQAQRPVTQPMSRPISQPIARPFFAPATPLMRTMPRTNTVPMWRPNSLAQPLAHPMVNNPVRVPGGRTGSPFLGDTPSSAAVVNPFAFNPALSNPAFFFHFHPIGGCASAVNCVGFAPFNPFFFGFGFGPCFTGGFGCGFGPFGLNDLAFGDVGFGGYGNGWFYPPAPEIPPPAVNPTEENPPLNFAPDYYFLPEVPYSEPQTAQKSTVKLALKDGTIFGVYSYWLQDNQLFYITTYNIKTSIPVDDLDLQKTVDLNQKLGVTFTLSNKPSDQQQPPEEQQQPE